MREDRATHRNHQAAFLHALKNNFSEICLHALVVSGDGPPAARPAPVAECGCVVTANGFPLAGRLGAAPL